MSDISDSAGAGAGAAAGAVAGAVARTVQALRAERGWSLDRLAARSGVSKGVLVALEQRRSNPNLATLARISDAFGVPVTRLVEVSGEPVVQLSGGRVLWNGAHGGTGTILAATDPPWATELWRWELRPGESFGGDAHTTGTREMAWVEQGTLTLTVAGERHRLTAGQCARFPGGQQHGYANEGDTTVLFTMVVVIPPALCRRHAIGFVPGWRHHEACCEIGCCLRSRDPRPPLLGQMRL
jgi:transcriptional regulator with XRE-family HTH domain